MENNMSEEQTGVIPGDADQPSTTGEVNSTMPVDKEPQTPDPKDAEIAALRKARDANAAKARKANEELIYAKGLIDAQKKEEVEQYDDDLLTREQFRSELEKLRHEQQQQQQLERVNNSVDKATKKYANSALTYEDVVEWASANYTPEQMAPILAQKDPAQTLYNIVSAEPENRNKIDSKLKKEAVQKTVDIINEHQNQPGTLSSAGGGNRVLDKIKEWDQMSTSDFVAMTDKIMREGRK
jgi:hypothetical protein